MAVKLDLSDDDENKAGKLCPFRAMQTETNVKFLACIRERCELWSEASWLPEGYDESLTDEGCAFRLIAEMRDRD